MSTTLKNFVSVLASAGSNLPAILLAVPAPKALSLQSAALGLVVDKFSIDLATAGYAKNGGVLLALSASTPVTIDLTNLAAQPVYAGDTTFAAVNVIIFANTGAHDVVISPGASNPFPGPLAGTAPTFTVQAGATVVWPSPLGWAVSGSIKTLKFDPGANACTIAAIVGGA